MNKNAKFEELNENELYTIDGGKTVGEAIIEVAVEVVKVIIKILKTPIGPTVL